MTIEECEIKFREKYPQLDPKYSRQLVTMINREIKVYGDSVYNNYERIMKAIEGGSLYHFPQNNMNDIEEYIDDLHDWKISYLWAQGIKKLLEKKAIPCIFD